MDLDTVHFLCGLDFRIVEQKNKVLVHGVLQTNLDTECGNEI